MAEQSFEYMAVPGGAPVKMWTRGVPVDDKARDQLSRAAKMAFIFKHVAAMPDVHVGIGATVGGGIGGGAAGDAPGGPPPGGWPRRPDPPDRRHPGTCA